jgi:hypothetical protein
MRGILINPFDQTIKEVVYAGDFREIYSLIDCTTFDVVRITPDEDMYVDDEGLLIDNQRYFTLLGTGLNNFAGKALLLSHNNEGETIATNWTLQQVKNMVKWLPEGHRETPYMEFKAWS